MRREESRGPPASPGAAPASSAADSRELVVPLPQPGLLHLCVEYPGYVGDEEKVLETLGGLEGIARQLQENPKTLPLRLRPGDRNCHATFATQEPSRRLLLKLTRPVPANNGASGSGSGAGGSSWDAEVVATLPHTYTWNSPADYQYVAMDSRPVDEQGLEQQAGINPPGFQPQPLLCPPPLFAKQPLFDYAFRGHVASAAPAQDEGAAASSAAAAAGGSGKKKAGPGVMASFFDLEVPQQTAPATLAAAEQRQGPLLRLLRSLLQQRPIWPVAALHEAVAAAGSGPTPAGRYPSDDLMPLLCYKFRNGPWKNTWTRRGFDPRTSSEARRWQCIEYHLPSDWYGKIAEHRKAAALAAEQRKQQEQEQRAVGLEAPAEQSEQQEEHEQQEQQEKDQQERQEQEQEEQAGGSGELPPLAAAYTQLLRFEAVPSTHSCSVQLGGVADSTVQRLLEDPANHAQICSDSSGWLATKALDAIKRRVKERFQAVLDGTTIEDDGGSFRAAAEAMQPGPAAVLAMRQQEEPPPSASAAASGAALPAAAAAAAAAQNLAAGAAGAAAGSAGPAGGAAAGPAPMEVDGDDSGAELAQQAQQQLRLQPPSPGFRHTPQLQRLRRLGEPAPHTPSRSVAAAAAGTAVAAGPASGGKGGGLHILPTGLMTELVDHLSRLPGQEEEEEEVEEEEEEEEGDEGSSEEDGQDAGGYHTDEGYQTEEGAAMQSEQD